MKDISSHTKTLKEAVAQGVRTTAVGGQDAKADARECSK